MSSSDSDGQNRPSGLIPFVSKSFLLKFVIALLGVVIVIGGVSYVTLNETSDELEQDVSTEYTGLASQSATQINEWQQSRIETARLYSRFEVIQSGTTNSTQSFLEAESSRLPEDIYRLHLVDLTTSDTEIIASNDPVKQGEPLNTREAPWQNQENLRYGDDDVFVSNASEVHLRSIVSFVSPVDDGNPDTNLVLVVMTNLDVVAQDLPTPQDTTDVYSQVVDAEGRVIAGTQETNEIERNDGNLETYSESEGVNEPAVRRALDGNSGFLQGSNVRSDLQGDFVVAHAPVPGDNLAVVTHVPRSYAFSLQSSIRQNLLILIVTTFLGLGLIGVAFGRQTTTALNRLTSKAQELESGNLEVDLEVNRADEFGRLTAAFANMRDALREQITEAEQARKEAEVSRAEAMEVNNYLEEKAQEYSEIMQACARGDLTARMTPEGENDAMDQIAENFNEMLSELELTTGQLKTFAEEVEEGGQAVKDSAEAVQNASQQIADSVQAVADDAYDQRERMQRLSEDIDETVSQLEALAEDNPDVDVDESLDRIRAMGDALQESVEVSDEAVEESDAAAAAAGEQAAELNDVTRRAEELTQYAQYLGKGLKNFETEQEHEFVFQTGGSAGPQREAEDDSLSDADAETDTEAE